MALYYFLMAMMIGMLPYYGYYFYLMMYPKKAEWNITETVKNHGHISFCSVTLWRFCNSIRFSEENGYSYSNTHFWGLIRIYFALWKMLIHRELKKYVKCKEYISQTLGLTGTYTLRICPKFPSISRTSTVQILNYYCSK